LVSDIEITPFLLPSEILPYTNGATFTTQVLPSIRITLKKGHQVQLSRISLTNPQSNVKKFLVKLIDVNGRLTEETVDAQSAFYVESFEPIATIIIKIVKTTDNLPARNVAISVIADIDCSDLDTTTVLPTTPSGNFINT
jgi:hypothetical protein